MRACLLAALDHDGPVYIRLGKRGEKEIHRTLPRFHIGGSHRLREGRDLCILSVGNMAPEVLEAAELLHEHGINAEIVSCYSAKPLDGELLARAFSRFPLVATVEEHSLIGGVGSAVAEWLADTPGPQSRVSRCVPPAPGIMPTRASGNPSVARADATRRSHDSASSRPPPRAGPSITASVTASSRSSRIG